MAAPLVLCKPLETKDCVDFIPVLPGLESCVANVGTYPVVLFLVFSEFLNELHSMNRRERKCSHDKTSAEQSEPGGQGRSGGRFPRRGGRKTSEGEAVSRERIALGRDRIRVGQGLSYTHTPECGNLLSSVRSLT